ncbi:MAG TPA: hypothetical protein PKB12_03430 [Elusimicrobiota bacterium]|nr:hypothetical protein [Elusimicrobiota bacterium]
MCRTQSNFRWFFLAALTAALGTSRFLWAAASPVELMQDALEAYFDERYEDSVHLFEKVLAQDPKNGSAQKGLKNAQRQRAAQIQKIKEQERRNIFYVEDRLKEGNLVDAYERLRDVLSRVPDHPDALDLKVKLRAKAEKAMAKARPDSSDYHYATGVLAYMDGDWFKAADNWQRILDFNPDRLDLVAKVEKAKHNLAEEQRQERLRVLTEMAKTNFKEGRFAEAKANWEEILTLEPHNEAAKEGIKKAVKSAEDEVQAQRMEQIQNFQVQAIDAYSSGKFKESVRLWDQVLRLDPSNTLARDYMDRIRSGGSGPTPGGFSGGPRAPDDFVRAVGYLKENRFVEAIEALERYLARNPTDSKADALLKETKTRQKEQLDLLYKEGLTAYAQGMKNQAIQKWQEALRVDPDFVRAKQALVKTMQEVRGQ